MVLILVFATFLALLLASVLILIKGKSKLRFLAFIPLGLVFATMAGAAVFSFSSKPFSSFRFSFPVELQGRKLLVQVTSIKKSENWHLSARSLQTGDTIWERDIPLSPDLSSYNGKERLVYKDRVVFYNVEPDDSTLVAVSLEDGTVLWETNLSDSIDYQMSRLLEQNGTLYFSYSEDSRGKTALVDLQSGAVRKILDYGEDFISIFQIPDGPVLFHQYAHEELGESYALIDPVQGEIQRWGGIINPYWGEEGVFTFDGMARLWLRNRFSGQLFLVSPYSFEEILGDVRPALWKSRYFVGFNPSTRDFMVKDIYNGDTLYTIALENGWSPDISYLSSFSGINMPNSPFHQITGDYLPFLLSRGEDADKEQQLILIDLNQQRIVWSSKIFKAFNFDTYDFFKMGRYTMMNINFKESGSTYFMLVDGESGEWQCYKRPSDTPYQFAFNGWSFQDGIIYGIERAKKDRALWALDPATGKQLYTDVLQARLKPAQNEIEGYLGPFPKF